MPLSRARLMVRFGLALLALGAAVIAYLVLSAGPGGPSTSAQVGVFVTLVIGGSGLLVALVGWRTLRLASPANAFARWTVPPAEWERYVAACRHRVTMPGALPNAVSLDGPVGTGGVEVLALKRGFRVEDAFHEIGGLGAEVLDIRVVDSPVDMFEFNVRYATGKTSSVALGVRIPLAKDAKGLGKAVEDYWIKREPLQTMSVEQLRSRERSGWVMALTGLVGFVGLIALFTTSNPPGWAAIGPIGALGLLGYGFIRGYRARMLRWRRTTQAGSAETAR